MTHDEFINIYPRKMNHYFTQDGVLHVGLLRIANTNTALLPDNLTVELFLDITGTKITTLPENLTINWWFIVGDVKITSFSENIKIKGIIYSDHKISMSEKAQINLIQQNEKHFNIIKKPTKNTKILQKLLWEI